MIVYRYISEEELKNILSGNIDDIGFETRGFKNYSNNFHYKFNEKYLHFYKNKEDMNRIKNIYKDYKQTFYFACFDIPFPYLLVGKGHGTYETWHGYDSLTENVREYIVNTKHFKKEWLKKYKKDTTKQIEDIIEL